MIIRQLPLFYRTLLLLGLSVVLMLLDHQTKTFHSVRIVASALTVSLETLVSLPGKGWQRLRALYPDAAFYRQYAALQQQRARLAREKLQLELKLQHHEAAFAKNQRLANVFADFEINAATTLFTQVIQIEADPFLHRIVIDRGIEAGVYVGQPLLGGQGVVGQVSEVNLKRSLVTLITSVGHGVPVQVQRNGLRTIVHGQGASGQLNVPFLPRQADIQKGDILITSSMGERFPPGYKVAEVTEIIKDVNAAFLHVRAVPTQRIDTIEAAMLFWYKHTRSATTDTLK